MPIILYNTKVQFDFGAVRLLGAELSLAKVRKPLVVADPGVVRAGLVARLGLPDPVVFDGVEPNPTEAGAVEGARLYKDAGCDGVIGLGGGSSMDQAKAIAVLATNPPPLEAYAFHKAGVTPPSTPTAPLFLVPTTAGTGSEVARAAVLVFNSGKKSLVFMPAGSTRCAILDPELTLGLPPGVTAATGMDAMAHCVETFCSPAINPPADAIARDGLRRLARHIERAVADGNDREARWNMMMGAMEGALAFQKGMGAVHALSHPLGELGLHHGTLNAVLMPHVLRWNAPALTEKFAVMQDMLGIGAGDVPAFFSALNERLGLPANLRALGVPAEALPHVAAAAMADSSHPTNPVPMTTAHYREVLQAAWQ
jgi:4-hydroxybutyrate dehydrogenase